MKTALVLATGLMAISTTASAGGYLGLGLGTEPGVSDELAEVATPSGRSLRLLGGYRFGRFSVEGALNGFGVLTGRGDHNVYQLSAAGKFNLPLGNNFEAFGRAGLEHTSLNVDDERYNLAGNGFLVGAVFDDAATGQGLLNFFFRAINCGAVTEEEAVSMTGVTLDELRGRSFVRILQNRRDGLSAKP